jgi:DNA-binding MarR family transcriptional regulator
VTVGEPSHAGERLEVNLIATAGLVRRSYDLRLAELGLNITESGLLQYLTYEQPLTQSDLAQRLHIGRMAAGSVVKDLLDRGLIERSRDPDDGRAWLIRLTAAGEELASTCIDVDDEVVRQLRADLSRDDQLVLHRLLDTVRANAQQLSDGLGAPDRQAPGS